MPRFCRHCGAQLSRPDASFCATCGRLLTAAPAQTPLHSAGTGSTPTILVGSAAAHLPTLAVVQMEQFSQLLALPSFTIGRDASNQIALNHPTVSRVHAEMRKTAQGHTITDVGSSNGTFINGRKTRASLPLRLGDVIHIGPYKFVYQVTALNQCSADGNYRLDALNLTRKVRLKSGLPWNSVATSRLILNDVSLSVFPHEFVALVGASGSGKSTLMNALNGFVPAEGSVLVNGDSLYGNFGAYRSIVGYVPQDDIIHARLPVRSALTYAARLRLPDATAGEVRSRVDGVLKAMELESRAEFPVRSLSGGQRKRVSIAVELLGEPGLFFLDEPTSGLDPGLEKMMMEKLRGLAQQGCTVVLVTHATANIALCDQVAFMADGRLVYYGPPQEAPAFFGTRDFAGIYSAITQPVGAGVNPAPPHWQMQHAQMMGRFAASSKAQPGAAEATDAVPAGEFWSACYAQSPQHARFVADRMRPLLSTGAAASSAAAQPAGRSGQGQRVSPWQQFLVLCQRQLELIRHDHMSLATLLLIMPLIGALLLIMAEPRDLVGEPAWQVETIVQSEIGENRLDADPYNEEEHFQGNYVVVGKAERLLFMLALAATLLGIFAAAYEIVAEEAIYKRERMVNLRIVPYIGAKLAVLTLFAVVQCFLLLWVVGRNVDLPEEGVLLGGPLEFYITLLLATLASLSLGLLISALVRSSGAVVYIILLVLFMQILFAGVIFSLPAAARPLSYGTITRWTVEALGITADLGALEEKGVSCVEFEEERFAQALDEPETPCREGQIRLPVRYEFSLDYDAGPGALVLHWGVLAFFFVACGALTWWVQRRKDVI